MCPTWRTGPQPVLFIEAVRNSALLRPSLKGSIHVRISDEQWRIERRRHGGVAIGNPQDYRDLLSSAGPGNSLRKPVRGDRSGWVCTRGLQCIV
jgi:hypothetical protein